MGETSLRDGLCPKCESHDVRSGAQIPFKRGPFGLNTIPLGGFFGKLMPLDNFVCVSCGYVESFVGGAADLRAIAQRWPRVSTKGETSVGTTWA